MSTRFYFPGLTVREPWKKADSETAYAPAITHARHKGDHKMIPTHNGHQVYETLKWPLLTLVEHEIIEQKLVNPNIKIVDQTKLMIITQNMRSGDAKDLCDMLNWMHDRIQFLEAVIETSNKEKEAADLVTDQQPQVSKSDAEATEPATRHETIQSAPTNSWQEHIQDYHPGLTFKITGYNKGCPTFISAQYQTDREYAHQPQSEFVRWAMHRDTMLDIDDDHPQIMVQRNCKICHPELPSKI